GVVARLGRDLRLLRYDLRGHGLSDAPAGSYSIADHVDDLAALLDARGIRDALVVGLSIGGMVAQAIAARRADLVRALILSDTAPRIGTAALWSARMDAIRKGGIASIAYAILERWFPPAYRERHPDDFAGYRNMLTRMPAEGYIGTCATLRDTDLSETTRTLRQPTLCLAGAEDTSTPPASVKAMSALIPGATFEIVADAGHLPCIERPDFIAARITAFAKESVSAER
ncbi:MAG TPA: 3-oxoadipate enol-lactonase, partial [Reyranella sp.]|nr:3-oxoadipate enol-lactonase [Reyranella sp.]